MAISVSTIILPLLISSFNAGSVVVEATSSPITMLTEEEIQNLNDDNDDEQSRIGYVTINSDGTTSYLINSTSIQAFAIGSIVVLIAIAFLYPILNKFFESKFGKDTPDTDYGVPYADPGTSYYQTPSTGYDSSSSLINSATTFSKRLNMNLICF